jgi:hypothetical protein
LACFLATTLVGRSFAQSALANINNDSNVFLEHVSFAYEVYKNAQDGAGATTATATGNSEQIKAKDVDPEEFKRTFCIPVMVDFVGVWSVGSNRCKYQPSDILT